MGDISYAPLIQDMTWSYSRASMFEACPYRWYLRYIRQLDGESTFFASYGSFMHKLIDLYYKGGLSPKQMQDIYLREFRGEVVGEAPNQKVFANYFKSGLQYLRTFKPMPFTPIETEKEVRFEVDGVPMVGIIDYLGDSNGELVIVDNKSRTLKPRSTRDKPTKSDIELDSYLRQLYLYAVAVEQEYGKCPKSLCFNCFRTQTLIEEPFDGKAYAESKQWFIDKVNEITWETDFRPDIEWFKCSYLCEFKERCEYFEMSKR